MQGQRIVIIGGTGGMGLSAARAMVRAGAKVVVTGRDKTHAEQALRLLHTDSSTAGTQDPNGQLHASAASGLSSETVADASVNTSDPREQRHTPSAAGSASDAGLPYRVLASDATVEGTAEEAIACCEAAFGPMTGLYHVAGGSGRKWGDGPLHEMSLEGWKRTLEENLDSLMLSNRAAIRCFLRQGSGGAILNMGSVLGFAPAPPHFSTHAYAAAKSAIIGFSTSLAAYYAWNNIRVNVIAPAVVDTPMAQRALANDEIMHYLHTKQPLAGGGAGMPADVDGIALLLLSDAGRYITGQCIAVDGGWSVSEGQRKGKAE